LLPSAVIAERIEWPYSLRTPSGKPAEWRPAYLPADPASRTAYTAGELAQGSGVFRFASFVWDARAGEVGRLWARARHDDHLGL
jgi:hypothetical protein